MPSKAPEKILSIADLRALTGYHRTTLVAMMKDPDEWAKPDGAKLIKDDYFLTVSFYNRWLGSKDIAIA